MTATGVPVLQDEVNRKAIETMSYLVTALHHRKINADQFSTGVDVLFMAVSGLVTDKDFIHIITEAQALINKEKKNGKDASETHTGTW
jgi:hypothetical protein